MQESPSQVPNIRVIIVALYGHGPRGPGPVTDLLMRNSANIKFALKVILAIAVLALLRYKPWLRSPRQTLDVAYLPVTCHLTCPVADYASKTSTTGTLFKALRYSAFPDIVEALKANRLHAGFVTVPLAMKMREQGAPIRIVCLGHRDGSEVTIRKDLVAQSVEDLRGKTIAIPSPLSNENFLFRKLLQQRGVRPEEIKIVVLPPPDMPTSLAAKAIDGFVVAEPFCSKAELQGTGRALYYAKNIWPHYISCCLVVNEDLISRHPDIVRDLVRGIVESGEWAETHRADAAKLVSQTAYFNQPEKLVNYVLTQPPDRVSYRMLNPTDAEIQRIMDMGIELGLLKKRTPLAELMDRRFIPAGVIQAAKIDMSKATSSSAR
jgi:NitT/TauT family transport system substrate-binding protein